MVKILFVSFLVYQNTGIKYTFLCPVFCLNFTKSTYLTSLRKYQFSIAVFLIIIILCYDNWS